MVCARMRGPLHRPRSCPCLFHASCIVLSNYVGSTRTRRRSSAACDLRDTPPLPTGTAGTGGRGDGSGGGSRGRTLPLGASAVSVMLRLRLCIFHFYFFLFFSPFFFVSLLSACLSACWTSGLCIAYGGLSAKWTCDGADALSYQGYQGTDCKEEKGPGFRVSGLGFGI